jgi:hypothetical protein
MAWASTQHYIGVVTSGRGAEATVISTQISYISPRPPVGNPEMYQPRDARMFMVDGWFTDRETFLAAVRPGRRLHLRNNRHQPILYGLYSTPAFAAEGFIEQADPETRTVTVRHMTDKKQRFTTTQTYTLPADGILRYEGAGVSPAEALRPGRHLRAHGARKQTVLGITPKAHLDTVEKRHRAWDRMEDATWVNEGWFAGYYHDHLFFTGESFRDGGGTFPIHTSQPGGSITTSLFTAYTVINGNFISSAAALRPGERALFVPDPIHSHRKASHVILHPADDGHVEGRVIRVDGDRVELHVTRTPTGRIEDLRTETVEIELAGDAVFHLNGRPGATRDETVRVGHTLRILPAWSGAMLVRDPDPDKGKVSGYGLANHTTTTRQVPRTGDMPLRISLHFGQTLFSPLNPAQYVDATFTWKDGRVEDLRVFSQRYPGKWRVKDTDARFEINGDRFTGWIEGHFSGGTITGYGVPGLYRFEIEGTVRNQVLNGEITRRTVDGVDHLQVPNQNVGPLDPRVGGVLETRPATSEPAVYRIQLHGGTPRLDPVVYLPRDQNGWGTGIAIYDHNRKTDVMEVDPSQLDWTPGGPAGSLRIRLSPTLLDNVSTPQWRTYHLSAAETPASGDQEPGRFRGSYRMVFGENPFLFFGPEDRVIQPDPEP